MNDPIIQGLAVAALGLALLGGLLWIGRSGRTAHADPGSDTARVQSTGLQTATFALG